ncbi:hypothetical protein Tco_0183931, partial [Tanacetum coccineum]
ACVFTDRWRLDELTYGIPSDGPYQNNIPSIEDIISSIRIDRDGQVRRIHHEEEIDVLEYQVLTREIKPTLKPLEEIIRENVFCLGGNRDHVPACLCYMLYCVVQSERFNLAYFMAKRIEWVTKQKRLILPYGMLLTRLFKFVVRENPELDNESYVLYDRVMNPRAAQLERKPRRDRGTRRGRHSTSFSSAFDRLSSSHLNDDDDDRNDEGTSRLSTPSPIRYINSLTNQVPQVFQNPPNERKIADLDVDTKVTLIDETQERYNEEMLFDVQDDLQGEEVVAEKEVVEKEVSAADPVTTAGEVVTTASATTTVDELTMAQTLIEIKAVKPKAVTTAATTITTVVNLFVPMDSEVMKNSEIRTKRSSERAGDELESNKSKKQKIDEHVEAEKDDDQRRRMIAY